MRTIEARISGLVQGVGYRYYARSVAHSLGIRGYVANLSDGGVLVVAQAADEYLEKFLFKLRQGPAFSSVDEIEITDLDSAETFKSFEIRHGF